MVLLCIKFGTEIRLVCWSTKRSLIFQDQTLTSPMRLEVSRTSSGGCMIIYSSQQLIRQRKA